MTAAERHSALYIRRIRQDERHSALLALVLEGLLAMVGLAVGYIILIAFLAQANY